MSLTAVETSADLKGALSSPGLIREDVMDKIWDISKIPLPFTDMIGKSSAKNEYKEWTVDELAAPDPTNRAVDGADAGASDNKLGNRVGNHHQISDKVVKVSYRADASDVIGRSKELSQQIMRRQQELRRDVEAIALMNQASFQDTGDSSGNEAAQLAAAGRVGGLPTWLESNNVNFATKPKYNLTTKLTVPGIVTADGITLTEGAIRDIIQDIYQDGGNATKLMATPPVIRQISEYLFTSSARVATLMSDQGKSSEKATALGAVNVFVTDFGTLTLVPNRLQMSYAAAYATPALDGVNSDVFILDPEYLSLCYVKGYRTDSLAKTGLAEKRQMSVDWSLIVNTEKAHGLIPSVKNAGTMTA